MATHPPSNRRAAGGATRGLSSAGSQGGASCRVRTHGVVSRHAAPAVRASPLTRCRCSAQPPLTRPNLCGLTNSEDVQGLLHEHLQPGAVDLPVLHSTQLSWWVAGGQGCTLTSWHPATAQEQRLLPWCGPWGLSRAASRRACPNASFILAGLASSGQLPATVRFLRVHPEAIGSIAALSAAASCGAAARAWTPQRAAARRDAPTARPG